MPLFEHGAVCKAINKILRTFRSATKHSEEAISSQLATTALTTPQGLPLTLSSRAPYSQRHWPLIHWPLIHWPLIHAPAAGADPAALVSMEDIFACVTTLVNEWTEVTQHPREDT